MKGKKKSAISLILVCMMIFSCIFANGSLVFAAGTVKGDQNDILSLSSIVYDKANQEVIVKGTAGSTEGCIGIYICSLTGALKGSVDSMAYLDGDADFTATVYSVNDLEDGNEYMLLVGNTEEYPLDTANLYFEGSMETDSYYVIFTVQNSQVVDGWQTILSPYVMTASPDSVSMGAVNFKDSGDYTSQDVTVNSTGTNALGTVSAALSGTNADKFEIVGSTSLNLTGASSSGAFTVRPKQSAITTLTTSGDAFVTADYTATLDITHATASALNVPVTVTIEPNTQAAPDASTITTAGISADGVSDGAISGITADMEYRLGDSGNFTSGTGSDITGLAAGVYQIRYKAVAATCTNPSPVITKTVPGFFGLQDDAYPLTYGDTLSASDLTITGTADGKATITLLSGTLPKGITFDGKKFVGQAKEVTNASVTMQVKDSASPTPNVGTGTYTFNISKKAFDLSNGLVGNGSFEIKKNSTVTLDTFFKVANNASAFNETASKVVDKIDFTDSNANISFTTMKEAYDVSGGSVTFVKPTDPAISYTVTQQAVAVSLAGISGTPGTYDYSIKVVVADGSTNYDLSNDITATGTLTVKEASNNNGGNSTGGGGGGGSSKATHTVTFDAGEHGTLSGSKTMSVVDGGKVSNAPSAKAKLGWRFLGWSLDGKTKVTFGDLKITEDTTFKALYEEVKKEGTDGKYINGYPDGTFRPDAGVTRAEVAAMIAQMVQSFDPSTAYTSNLSDLVSGEWYVNYVNFCASKGMVSGYEDRTFQPDRGITRAEFATIIAKYLSLENVGSGSFSDISGHWAEGYITQLSLKGIAHGYENNTFRPDAPISRAEAATMLNKAFGREPNKEEIQENIGNYSVNLSDVTPEHWAYYQILEAAVEHAAADFHK